MKILRPFIQFAIIILAFWISLTRISDYFHHPFDVVTGALVGITFALITLTVAADIFNKRSAFVKMFRNDESKSLFLKAKTGQCLGPHQQTSRFKAYSILAIDIDGHFPSSLSSSSDSAAKTQFEGSEARFRQLRDTEPLEMQGGVAGTKYESRSKTTIQYTSTANK